MLLLFSVVPLALAKGATGLEAVHAFAERLATLPYQRWLEIGRTLPADASERSPRAATPAALEAAIAAQGLAFAAWLARDAVETAAFLATDVAWRCSARERRVIARTRRAAEAAALALLVRDALPPPDFATLLAPFEHALPGGEGPGLSVHLAS
jgi:hypothetical protein